jgi:DNA polymerase-3 subunit beta
VRVTFSREALLAALQSVEPLVAKVTKNGLRCAKVELQQHTAKLVATNGDVHVWQEVPVLDLDQNIAPAWEMLLPVAQLCKMLKFLSGESVVIDCEADRLEIRDEVNSYKLATEPVSVWPSVTLRNEKPVAVIAACQFRTMLKRTAFCCDSDSTRYALGGVCLAIHKGNLEAAATDTRRLSMCAREATLAKSVTVTSAIIPSQAVALILRAIEDTPADLEVWWDDKAATFRLSDKITIRTRLVEGKFPNYREMFDGEGPAWTTVLPVDVLKRLTSAASVVSDAESRGADMIFERPNLLSVTCQSAQGMSRFTEHTNEHETVNYPLDTLTVTLDPTYVSQYLQTLPGESLVRIELTDDESGVLFVPHDSIGTECYMLMPLTRER